MLRLTVFQYLPFFSYALPLAPIGALGIGVLPKSHPTVIYRQIAFGAAIACPRSGWLAMRDATRAASHCFSVPPFFLLCSAIGPHRGSRDRGTA